MREIQRLDDERWDQRYGGNSGGARGMTAIERREQEMQITTVVPKHRGQQQQGRVAAIASPRGSPSPDVVVLKPLRASVVNDDAHYVSDNKEATAEEMRNARDIDHALANPDKNIQFMTSEAKSAVDDIKRQQYLIDLQLQIDQQHERKRITKEREEEEDRQREIDMRSYQPFGRQGAGAPLRTTSGQVITNLRKENSRQDRQERQPMNTRNPSRGVHRVHMNSNMAAAEEEVVDEEEEEEEEEAPRVRNGRRRQPRQQQQPPPPPSHKVLHRRRESRSREHQKETGRNKTGRKKVQQDSSGTSTSSSSPPALSKVIESQRNELLRLRSENQSLREETIHLSDNLYDSQSQVDALERVLQKYKDEFGSLRK